MKLALSRLSSSSPRRATLLAAALIVLAGLLAYRNSFDGPFVFDDPSSIAANPTLRTLWPPWAPLLPPRAAITVQGRPVLNLSLALNYAFGREAVRGYHAMNLAIHLGAALTLFGLVGRTLQQPSVAPRFARAAWSLSLTVALLWAVHPLQTQAVTYVIQRAESLMGVFYLLTLYFFVRGLASPTPHRWFGLSVAACYLGMGTKEVMVSAPIIVLLYDRAFVAGSFAAAWRARRGVYIGLASSWVLLACLVASTGGNRGGAAGFDVGVGWWDYALTQFVAIAHYLRLALWPRPLVFEYGTFWVDDPATVVTPAVVVLGLTGATLLALWRRPALGFLGCFFFAILSVTSVVPGTTQMIVEHRMYLPLAALIVGAVLTVHSLLPGHTLPRWAPAVVALGLLTHARNHDYRDERVLWRDTVAKRPDNALAHEMLAQALERTGEIDAAIAERQRALEIFPTFAVAHCNLGDTLSRLGKIDEAIPHYEAALASKPAYADAHNGLGAALARAGRLPDAIAHFTRAIALSPDHAEAHANLANAFALTQQPDDAVRAFEQAIRLAPENPRFHFTFGNLLVALGRKPAACDQFAAAVRLAPEFVDARANLGAVLLELQRPEEARREFEHVLRLTPELATAHLGLGEAFFALGRTHEARAAYRRALELDPALAPARAALRRVDSAAPASSIVPARLP